DAYLAGGLVDAARETVDDGLAVVQRGGERFYEAELHRLRGEVLLTAAGTSEREAEDAFRQAMAVARSQHAALLLLRAAVSLGRLWHRAGRATEARELVI